VCLYTYLKQYVATHTKAKGKAVSIQASRVPGSLDFQISRQSAHEAGKVDSPMHQLPLPLQKNSRHSFLFEAESTPGP